MIKVTRERPTSSRGGGNARITGQAGNLVGIFLSKCGTNLGTNLIVIAAFSILVGALFVLAGPEGQLPRILATYVFAAAALVGAGTTYLMWSGLKDPGVVNEAVDADSPETSLLERVELDFDDGVLALEHEAGMLIVDRDETGATWCFDVPRQGKDPRWPEIGYGQPRSRWSWIQNQADETIEKFVASGQERRLDLKRDADLSVLDIELGDRHAGPVAMRTDLPFRDIRRQIVDRLLEEQAPLVEVEQAACG